MRLKSKELVGEIKHCFNGYCSGFNFFDNLIVNLRE